MVEQTTTQPDLPPAHAAVLRRIAHMLAHTTESGAFLRAALVEVSELLRPAVALVLRRDRDELIIVAAASPAQMFAILPLQSAPQVNAALADGQTILIEPPGESALAAQLGPLLPTEVGAVLFAPLVAQGKALGALLIGAPPGQAFAPADAALAELVASSLTSAVYVGRLSESMRRRSDQLTMVADIAAQVSSSLETREVYRLVVLKLKEYFRVGAGSLLLKDEGTDELVFIMTLEGSEERLFGTRLPPGVGIAGYVAQTQQPYISNDVQNDPRHYRLIAEKVGLNAENMLCVPMVVKGSTIGVIELLNKQDGFFSEEEAQRLSAVANIIGVAIENARLFEFVRQRRDRLERLLERMQQGLTEDKLIDALTREVATQDNLLVVKFTNPYIVGAPVLKPEMCFGREPLFKRVLSVLHQNSLLLHGERRIGKTTVLRQLELRLNAGNDPEYRFKPVYIDLQGLEEATFFHHIMEEVLHRFGKRAKGLSLRYSSMRSSYPGREFQRDLRTVITTLCGPQPDGRIDRLVLLMDEADVMYGYDERVLQEFRRIFMNDYAAYLSVVFAAVNIHHQWKRYESPLYNLFQQLEITPLSRPDTELLVRTPVRGRYDYDEAAVGLIFHLSNGRPLRIQQLCLEAINYIREQSRTVVTADDVERVGETLKGQDLWI